MNFNQFLKLGSFRERHTRRFTTGNVKLNNLFGGICNLHDLGQTAETLLAKLEDLNIFNESISHENYFDTFQIYFNHGTLKMCRTRLHDVN